MWEKKEKKREDQDFSFSFRYLYKREKPKESVKNSGRKTRGLRWECEAIPALRGLAILRVFVSCFVCF